MQNVLVWCMPIFGPVLLITCPILTLPPLGLPSEISASLPVQSAQTSIPLAYFPLTGGDLESLLLPAYNGSLNGTPQPSWVQDSIFASVINCSRVSPCQDQINAHAQNRCLLSMLNIER
jgi:hypothetical protein